MPPPDVVEKLRSEWLRTCAHEAGHGVIAVVQGIPVEFARVWYQGHGRHTTVGGVMRRGPFRRGGLRGVQRADAELLMALAGAAAETMWRRRAERVGAGAAGRAAEGMSGGDLRNARAALRESSLSLSEGRAVTRQLVREHWSDIERTARELARRGYLPGSLVRVS